MNIPSKDEIIKKAGDLKVLPFVARKLLETLGDENATIADLGEIIEKDQTISARVLKISNSALYGLRHEVTSINQAILILGFKTIRSIVISASTKSLYKNFGMKEKIIWEHSIGAGIGAKIISRGMGSDIEEIAFVGGLMHDLGKVILNNETPEQFSEVIMTIYNDGVDSIQAEEDMYGYNHAEIGAGVAEKWGFPEVLVNIIRNHHLNSPDGIDKALACVNLADWICKVAGIGYRQEQEGLSLEDLPSARYLNIDKKKMEALISEIKETFQNEKSVFE
jgi:putative nucleotidyltransferase with HDIG domain